MRRLRRARLPIALALCAGIAALPVWTEADHALGPHWSSDARRVVVVDKTGSPSWARAIQTAVAQWNQQPTGVLLELVTAPPDGCLPAASVPLCLGDPGPGFVGVTRLWAQPHDGHLSRGQVVFRPVVGYAWKVSLACHEIGHVLGLAHNTAPDSCLWHGGRAVIPDPHDWEELRVVYGHEDAVEREGGSLLTLP